MKTRVGVVVNMSGKIILVLLNLPMPIIQYIIYESKHTLVESSYILTKRSEAFIKELLFIELRITIIVIYLVLAPGVNILYYIFFPLSFQNNFFP